jgi:phenylalanyl-tRNA synthetase beta chain
MGGQVSEVSEKTTHVLMEAATWVGPNILQTSKKLGLRSEASTRFEKQLHPEQAIAAQRLAARLMVELCGARMAPGTIDAHPEPLPPHTVDLRLDRVERLLGKAIGRDEVVAILDSLGFTIEAGEVLKVTVPPWRDSDVRREADLIEEVARIYGLHRLPTTLPARERAVGRLTPSQRLRRRLEDALRDRGLHEVVAWSFTSPQALERLRVAGEPPLALANPLSEDQSVMRPLLLPGLLDAARHNAAHGAAQLALFESGHIYRPANGLDAPEGSPRGATPATERHHIGAVLTQRAPATWRSPAAPADFYVAKGLVEALAAAARLDIEVAPGRRPFLHPGRSATVTVGGCELGWIGELHPLVARAWDLDGAAAFELDAGALAEEAEQVADFHDVTSFPAVLQDIAVVVPAEVSAADVRSAVREGGGELLASTEVFDVYTGEQAGEGNRSLALRLRFRAPDRTLTDAEVAELRTAIEATLERIGGRLRG